MLFYCDTSALTKLVVHESESTALVAYLGTDFPLVSSDVAITELPRAVLRRAPEMRERIDQTLDSLTLVTLSVRLLNRAGAIPPPQLRSLDAIHLASALTIRDELRAFIAYDTRLLEAAAALGLPVASPGLAQRDRVAIS